MELEDQVDLQLGNTECPRGRCYRCWQVGRDERAICIVQHGWRTQKSWTAPSCQRCAERDTKAFSSSRVIARIAVVNS